jgi:hypothetical protein
MTSFDLLSHFLHWDPIHHREQHATREANLVVKQCLVV